MKYNTIFDRMLWATFAQFWWCGGTTVGGEVENSSKLRILTKSAIWTKCIPKQFVANDHRFQNLRSFDVIGCLGGSERIGVLIPIGFCTRNAC